MAGSSFKVRWEGPNNKQDFVTIVEEGANEGRYEYYQYTSKGDELELVAPEIAGKYEVRYLTGLRHYTLAKTSVSGECKGQFYSGK